MFSPSGGNPAKQPAPVTGVQSGSRGGVGQASVLLLWPADDRLGNYERSFLNVAQEWLCHDTEST